MTRILCLWFPNWAIQRIIRGRPELKARPVALVASAGQVSSGTQSIVAACCGRAIAQGVRPGMPLAEAQALSRELQVAVYESSADRRALAKLAEMCERFSPRVALEEGNEPESLLLDISDLEHLYGDEAKLVEQVKEFFTRRGYRVRLAVAETVGAAWALAHFEEGGECKLQIAEPPAPSPQSLVSLPIEALRIDDATIVLLRQLGIETVDQLLALPREGLASRFGEELLRRLDQLSGSGRELIEPHRGEPALAASYALEEPTGDRGMLAHVLKQLVGQLAAQLMARDQGAVVVMGLLRCKGGQEVQLRVGLLQPSASAWQLWELIELHLETVRLASEVDRVELRATVVGRLGERQRKLFADCWPIDPHQLAMLVNRLSSRLGQQHVLRAKLRASPVPERAVGWAPAVEKRDRQRGRQGDKKKRRSHSPCLPFSLSPCLSSRPLVFYQKPEATEVTCVAPDGPPQFVWVDKRRERIVHCVGPERIETLWWRGPSLRRDYYRVATEAGGHLWMFRRLADGRWFVHGVFN